MKNIFQEFEPINQENRLELIQKELKRELLPNPIKENIFSDPYVLPKKLKQRFSPIPKTKSGWYISQKLVANDLKSTNIEALLALNGGVSALTIHVENQFLTADFEILFKDILINVIVIRFDFANASIDLNAFLDEFEKYLLLKKYNVVDLNIIVLNLGFNDGLFKKYIFLKYEICQDSTLNLVESIASLLSAAEKLLVLNKDLRPYFKLKAESNFYLNIAQTKVLKILWPKIQEAYGLKSFFLPFVSIVINENNEILEPNAQAIMASHDLVSAINGGADLIEINNLNYDINDFSEMFSVRITRNIQNILEAESFMGRVDDPTAGSYFLDDLMQRLMADVWAIFIKD
jgi:methylmalonyl-CoA mutase